MAWAYMLVLCVLFAWRVESHRVIDAQQDGYERAVYPTALGDTAYYNPVGFDDFFAANVPCPGQTTGLYRRMHQPVHRDDARMIKLDPDASGSGVVYREDKRRLASDGTPLPSRLYLKAGENLYIEFGPQRFWRAYEVPKAIPYTPPEIPAPTVQ